MTTQNEKINAPASEELAISTSPQELTDSELETIAGGGNLAFGTTKKGDVTLRPIPSAP